MLPHPLQSSPLRARSEIVKLKWRAPHHSRAFGRHRAAAVHTEASVSGGSASKGAPQWPVFLSAMAMFGAVTGTLLDGIHSRVQLQIYDVLPLTVGPLDTSMLVPPLLASFYVTLAVLQYYLDAFLKDNDATQAALTRSKNAGFVALGGGVLAVLLYVSATLFQAEFPAEQIFAVLAAAALVNWRLLDNTPQGFGLAVLCALGAPAAEIVLNHFFHLWHYPRADLFDGQFVSWVPWCYFFYTPALSNLSRHMWQR